MPKLRIQKFLSRAVNSNFVPKIKWEEKIPDQLQNKKLYSVQYQNEAFMFIHFNKDVNNKVRSIVFYIKQRNLFSPVNTDLFLVLNPLEKVNYPVKLLFRPLFYLNQCHS